MTEQEFQDLCRNVSLELGKEDVNSLGETGHMEIDGVEFAVHFLEDQSPDMIYCYVKLGIVPERERAEVYENLLRLNMVTGSKTVGVFALDHESENAVLVAHITTAGRELSAKGLVRRFRLYAQQAITMRESYLAGPVKTPTTVAEPRGSQLA